MPVRGCREVTDRKRYRCRSRKIFADHHDGESTVRGSLRCEHGDVVRIWSVCRNAGVAERRLVSIIVAIHLDRLVSRRAGVGRGPARGQIQIFASEDSKDVRLCRCSVDVAFGAPVVFGDPDGRASVVVGVYPAAQPWYQLDRVELFAVLASFGSLPTIG